MAAAVVRNTSVTVVPADQPTPRNLTLQKVAKVALALGLGLLFFSPIAGVTLSLLSAIYLWQLKSIDRLRDGTTQLQEAVRLGSWTRVGFLCRFYGANPNTKDEYTDTPVHTAAFHDNARVLQQLMKAGGDINAVGNMGRVPLHYAVGGMCKETCRVLKSAGANTAVRDQYEGTGTPLERAQRNLRHRIQYPNQESNTVTRAQRLRDCAEIVRLLQQ